MNISLYHFIKTKPQALLIAGIIFFVCVSIGYLLYEHLYGGIIWKTYRNEQKGYEFTYRADYVILHENGYGVTLNTGDKNNKVITVTISNNQTDWVYYSKYQYCSKTITASCSYNNWSAQPIEQISLSSIPAKSLYMTFAERKDRKSVV